MNKTAVIAAVGAFSTLAPASSYAQLLEPVKNPVEALRQSDLAQNMVCYDAYGRPYWCYRYDHHHHHHYRHHHHHHHHHHYDE